MSTPPGTPHVTADVDLHTHSRCSDGVLEPRVLVDTASACGVRLLAISDHDTLAGYRDATGPGAPPLPPRIELVPAVEINALASDALRFAEGELHVLGLGVDPDDGAFEELLACQRDARSVRFQRTLERLRTLGIAVDDGAAGLARRPGDALGRPIVARLLVAAGYALSVDDAFARLLGRGRPGYVAREGIGPAAAVRAIRDAGGMPVLAHFSESITRRDLMRELIEHGLAGLEVRHPTFDAGTEDALDALAGELALVPTGGTDYHGDTGPYEAAHARLHIPAGMGDRVRAALGWQAQTEAEVGGSGR